MKKLHVMFFIASSILFISIAWSAMVDTDRQWKHYQVDFKDVKKKVLEQKRALLKKEPDRHAQLIALIKEELARIDRDGYKIEQIIVNGEERVDRCTSCHLAADKEGFENEQQPFKTHSSDYLQKHPVEKFGCTVCHEGQGLATKKKDAHGYSKNWDFSILSQPYIQANCAKCHSDLKLIKKQAPRLAMGAKLFEDNGCGCCHDHLNRGVIKVGPEISTVGDKIPHDFDFTNIEGEEHSVINWHLRHLEKPDAVVKGSEMPPTEAGIEDLKSIVVFILSLRTKDLPPDLIYKKFKELIPE